MSALPLLSEIAGRGVCIRADGHNLVVSQDKMTGSLDTRIRENKPALIASLTRLRQYADGDADWQGNVSHPEQLRAFIYSLVTTETRERGQIPSSYTATVHCQSCHQDVSHFPIDSDTVEACVWCMNGQAPPPLPGTIE